MVGVSASEGDGALSRLLTVTQHRLAAVDMACFREELHRAVELRGDPEEGPSAADHLGALHRLVVDALIQLSHLKDELLVPEDPDDWGEEESS